MRVAPAFALISVPSRVVVSTASGECSSSAAKPLACSITETLRSRFHAYAQNSPASARTATNVRTPTGCRICQARPRYKLRALEEQGASVHASRVAERSGVPACAAARRWTTSTELALIRIGLPDWLAIGVGATIGLTTGVTAG